MVEKQRDVQPQGEPLLSTQEHDAKEAVDGVFRQHQLKREQRQGPELQGEKVTPASPAADTCLDPAFILLGTPRASPLQHRVTVPGLWPIAGKFASSWYQGLALYPTPNGHSPCVSYRNLQTETKSVLFKYRKLGKQARNSVLLEGR